MRRMRAVLVIVFMAVAPIPVVAQSEFRSRFNERSFADSRPADGDFLQTSWQSDPVPAESQADNAIIESGSTPGAWSGPAASAAAVEGPLSTSQTWWIIAPYAWIPGIHGQVTTFGQTRSVDIDTSNVLDHLHNANGGLQLHLESGRGPIGLILDTNIIRFSNTVATPAGTIDFNIQQTLIEFLGMFRVLEVSTSAWSPKQTYAVDLLAGGRYYNFFNGVALTPAIPPPPSILLGQSATWVDLVFGVRGRAPLAQGLDAFVRADFGGFGMGDRKSVV